MRSATVGRLEVICGPMFSGKTTELVRRLMHARMAGAGVLGIKPVSDQRYHDQDISTHTGDRFPAATISVAAEIGPLARVPGVVGIDEAHFFGVPLLEECVRLVAAGKRVIVAGVERDHRGGPFEPFPNLLCEADEVLKLSGPCAVCGRPAVHSQRMIASEEAIVVGGAGMYQARCRACFQAPQGEGPKQDV